jgi:hypothetical protein
MESDHKDIKVFGWLILDWWRKTDLLILLIYAALFLGRRLTFIPAVMFFLTGLEVISEYMIYRVNRQWEGTAAGGAWIRKNIATVRWISIPIKTVLIMVTVMLLSI